MHFLHQSHQIQMQEKVAEAFLSKFQLHTDEAKLLRGPRNVPVTEVIAQCLIMRESMLLLSE